MQNKSNLCLVNTASPRFKGRGPSSLEQGVDLGFDLLIGAVLEGDGPGRALDNTNATAAAFGGGNFRHSLGVYEWSCKGAGSHAGQAGGAQVGIDDGHGCRRAHFLFAENLGGLLGRTFGHGKGLGDKPGAVGETGQEDAGRGKFQGLQFDMSLQKKTLLGARQLQDRRDLVGTGARAYAGTEHQQVRFHPKILVRTAVGKVHDQLFGSIVVYPGLIPGNEAEEHHAHPAGF